ncbi:MAG: hypothetical protein GF311_28415 [Candidatus Lokiarchaeota archaeon]|nr:hypothetical protein [Candidatus Lokiarchaeota archaeon]
MKAYDWVRKKVEEGLSRQEIYSLYDDFLDESNSEMSESAFKRTVRRLSEKDEISQEFYEEEDDLEAGEKRVISRSHNIKTLDDLYLYNELDKNIWVPKSIKTSHWGNDKNPMYSINAVFKQKEAEDISFEEKKQAIAEAVQSIKINEIRSKVKKVNNKKSGNLLEISLYDHHFGQLSWKNESGQDYDITIASQLYNEALINLTESGSSYAPEKILFVIGGDFFNANSSQNVTFAGTPQVEDTRWQKTFSEGVSLILDGIEYLRKFAGCVEVLLIQGNHDFERLFYLGVVLEKVYAKAKDVIINNSPKTRKYFSWGKVLLGFSHGDAEVKDGIPLIMSREVKECWNEAKYIEFHKGHFHKTKKRIFTTVDEEFGIIERYLPSLTARDDWHFRKGYISTQESQSFVWNKEKGNLAILKFHP